MTKSLESLMKYNPVTIAKLERLKWVIRVETPRRCKWFIVTPARLHEDARCLLIHEVNLDGIRSDQLRFATIGAGDSFIISEYRDRIVKVLPA